MVACKPESQCTGGRGRQTSVCLRSAWSIQGAPRQLELHNRYYFKSQKQRNEGKEGREEGREKSSNRMLVLAIELFSYRTMCQML